MSPTGRRGEVTERRMRPGPHGWIVLALVVVATLSGCHSKGTDRTLPTPAQVKAHYQYKGRMDVKLNGNVAEIEVAQPVDQLRRGGTLWAKVGPYIFLFTDDTEQLFEDFPGLAGVRVITYLRGGGEIARAMLTRSELNDLTWKRALNIAGHARAEGTQDPKRIQDLVDWGEDHTQFKYNPRYVPR